MSLLVILISAAQRTAFS